MPRNRMRPAHRRQVKGLHWRLRKAMAKLSWVQARKEYWHGRAVRSEYALHCIESRGREFPWGISFWSGMLSITLWEVLCRVVGW